MVNTVSRNEVLVIGAGITGIHQLIRLKELGIDARLLEAGSGVGGTWFWNRYPEARFDSESYTYGYFFSEELWNQWDWSEHFAGQPETERYLNHVVDHYALRDLIDLDSRVQRADFDESRNEWTVQTTDGRNYVAPIVVTAVGILSAPFYPDYPGRDRFGGNIYHTGEWPLEQVDFTGKRVAIIGTGASGVQLIPPVAEAAVSLTVYQRTPNWVTPLNNGPLEAEYQQWVRDHRDDLREACASTFAAFMHPDPTKGTFDDDKQARWDHYKDVIGMRGLAKLFSNYTDLMLDKAANNEFCEFLAEQIRNTVEDTDTAKKLIPTDHGFGEKRPPMGTRYFETYNRPNVSLIDLRTNPIREITATGIATSEDEQEFDIIVFATGFDAITGALTRIDFRGTRGKTLAELWEDGPLTYFGIQAPGFPNLLMAGGAHSTYGNVPRSTEVQVEFITGLIQHARENGWVRLECDDTGVEAWTNHVYDNAAGVLTAETAWYVGSNIPGKAKRFLLYIGGNMVYRDQVHSIAAQGYPGFHPSAPVSVEAVVPSLPTPVV
jgi:cation diffusion facilitator CzcD-associated flavoprotein CzcO